MAFPEFFTPQNEWLDQVGRIYVLLGVVTVDDTTSDHHVELRRKNRINSVYSSTVIEGNRLSLDQATAVIDGVQIFGPERDILEVQNAWAAYEQIDDFDPYSVTDFLKAHRLLTKGLIAQSGDFRKTDVEIVSANGEVLHTGSRFAKVPRLIGELLVWARDTNVHPLIASSAVHFMIEQIHPFTDGNGRIGRLWQTLILSKWNSVFAWMPTETLISRDQLGYYTALQNSREPEIDAAPFITFMLGIIERSLLDYRANVVDDVVKDVVDTELLLEYLRDNPQLSAARLAGRLGVSSRQVQRIIKTLKEQGRLTREGSPRSGTWKVVP
ncbi:MAG: Fic family protein [Promicromonosporaceae bacterium]|nr:Fic family protein [Promicromonosporaceae bacterium]